LMVQKPCNASRRPLPERERAAVARLVKIRGEAWTREALDVSRHTLGRVLGGLTCTKGTLALVSLRLAAIEERGL
jgi:hypothetical protein